MAQSPNCDQPAGAEARCPLAATVRVIGGKWKPLIWWRLQTHGTMRFAALQKSMPGVTPRMLTLQLRELERDTIVERRVFAEVPPRVEYSLTPYGQTLAPIFTLMCEWGLVHMDRRAPD